MSARPGAQQSGGSTMNTGGTPHVVAKDGGATKTGDHRDALSAPLLGGGAVPQQQHSMRPVPSSGTTGASWDSAVPKIIGGAPPKQQTAMPSIGPSPGAPPKQQTAMPSTGPSPGGPPKQEPPMPSTRPLSGTTDVDPTNASTISGRKDQLVKLAPTVFNWFIPGALNALCLKICMWLLHGATYYYIIEMTHFEAANNTHAYSSKAMPPISGPYGSLSPGKSMRDVSYGSLEDPLESMMGFKAVNIHLLDGVAALIPLIWIVGVCYARNLQLFTKVMLCNGLLAIGKGVLGLITIVPDSSGWANCKARLGEEHIQQMIRAVPDPFEYGISSMLLGLLRMEIFGPVMRYCADMMYSGHTYFVCLYALGLLELVWGEMVNRKTDSHKQNLILGVVIGGCLAQQFGEIYLVLLSRFHYTMDIAVAIVMTFLLYTNGPVVICAKWWAHRGTSNAEKKLNVRMEGDIYVPPCCCCWHLDDYHHLISTKEQIKDDETIALVKRSHLDAVAGTSIVEVEIKDDEMLAIVHRNHGSHLDAVAGTSMVEVEIKDDEMLAIVHRKHG